MRVQSGYHRYGKRRSSWYGRQSRLVSKSDRLKRGTRRSTNGPHWCEDFLTLVTLIWVRAKRKHPCILHWCGRDQQPCNGRSVFADFGDGEIDMGAHSLLLRAEQRENIHADTARAPRHMVLSGLLYVVKPEENIYCASRSFWGEDAAMARTDSKREHHMTITLACFLEAIEAHNILEWASNRFNKVTKYYYSIETDALRYICDSWTRTKPSYETRCVSMAADEIEQSVKISSFFCPRWNRATCIRRG